VIALPGLAAAPIAAPTSTAQAAASHLAEYVCLRLAALA
jgi:hypothetical protein